MSPQTKRRQPCDARQKPLRPPRHTDPRPASCRAGRLENKQEHANLAEQMRHVEVVIKMLDPGYSLRAISVKRRQPNPWFKRGTVYRRAVDVLRTAIPIIIMVAISPTAFAQSKRNQAGEKQPPAKFAQPEGGKKQPKSHQAPIIVNETPA